MHNIQQNRAQPAAQQGDGDRFLRRAIVGVGLAGVGVVLLLFAWQVLQVLLLVFAGLLLAILLRMPANLLARHTPLGGRLALALVLLSIVGATALGVQLMGPQIAAQFSQLIDVFPSGLAQLREYLQQSVWGRWVLEQAPPLGSLMPEPSNLVGRVTGIFSSVFGVLTNVLIITFVGLYLAIQPQMYRNGIIQLLPHSKRKRGREVLNALGFSLTWWLIGRLFSMVILGVSTWLGLLVIGVPLALPLGILSGLFNFIPIIGPILGLVPASVVALTQSPTTLLYVVLLYYAVQIVESYILTPAVQQKAVQMPPVFALFVQLVLGVLAGTLGVALAFPLAVVILVLVKLLYVEDVLGDEIDMPGERADE